MKEEKVNENNNSLIKLAIYLGLFLAAVLIIRFGNINNKSNNIKTEEKIKILNTIKNMSTNSYKMDIHLILDDDAITLEYEKNKELLTGIKKYHGKVTNYIKKDEEYYLFDNGKFEKLNNFIEFDYDKTFTSLENIKKLIELEGEKLTYTNNEEETLKITYKIKDIINAFNYEINNDENTEEKRVTLEINYKDDSITYLLINITDFYNLLNENKQDNVIYKIKIKQTKEQDISWINELLK